MFCSVKRVFADQIYIDIDGSYGRVHATEMLDSIEDVRILTHNSQYSLNETNTQKEVIFV